MMGGRPSCKEVKRDNNDIYQRQAMQKQIAAHPSMALVVSRRLCSGRDRRPGYFCRPLDERESRKATMTAASADANQLVLICR